MIISASYKTALPAFFGEWFAHRLDAGFCRMVNPYNPAQRRRISLLPEDVDGFFFWTKDIGPFLPQLAELRRREMAFVVHHTITAYPRELEPHVPRPQQAIDLVRRVAETYGPRCAVWRYDPLLFSALTPPERHYQRFAAIAERLAGAVDEVIVSFTSQYRKTQANLRRAEVGWYEPPDDEKRAFVRRLAELATAHGITLRLCCGSALAASGVPGAHCTDAQRLSDVAGRTIVARGEGNRPDCGCAAAVDIGDYDTCGHGCVYCYAVRRPEIARQRREQRHDPTAEYLIVPDRPAAAEAQLPLF